MRADSKPALLRERRRVLGGCDWPKYSLSEQVRADWAVEHRSEGRARGCSALPSSGRTMWGGHANPASRAPVSCCAPAFKWPQLLSARGASEGPLVNNHARFFWLQDPAANPGPLRPSGKSLNPCCITGANKRLVPKPCTRLQLVTPLVESTWQKVFLTKSPRRVNNDARDVRDDCEARNHSLEKKAEKTGERQASAPVIVAVVVTQALKILPPSTGPRIAQLARHCHCPCSDLTDDGTLASTMREVFSLFLHSRQP